MAIVKDGVVYIDDGRENCSNVKCFRPHETVKEGDYVWRVHQLGLESGKERAERLKRLIGRNVVAKRHDRFVVGKLIRVDNYGIICRLLEDDGAQTIVYAGRVILT